MNVNPQISASPQIMLQQAQKAGSECEKLAAILSSVDEKMKLSSFLWDSEGARKIRQFYQEDRIEFQQAKAALTEGIEILREIAIMYQRTEGAASKSVEALPGPVLD